MHRLREKIILKKRAQENCEMSGELDKQDFTADVCIEVVVGENI